MLHPRILSMALQAALKSGREEVGKAGGEYFLVDKDIATYAFNIPVSYYTRYVQAKSRELKEHPWLDMNMKTKQTVTKSVYRAYVQTNKRRSKVASASTPIP